MIHSTPAARLARTPAAAPVSDGTAVTEPAPCPPVHRLTPKERQVVALLVRGLTVKQAARELGGISHHTVATHLRRAYAKLEVHDRSGLRSVAAVAGLA